MESNGKRRPPRPRIEMRASAATPEEAAAVTAALRRFMADTAPPPSSEPADTISPWQRVALIEGVSAKSRAIDTDPGAGFPLA